MEWELWMVTQLWLTSRACLLFWKWKTFILKWLKSNILVVDLWAHRIHHHVIWFQKQFHLLNNNIKYKAHDEYWVLRCFMIITTHAHMCVCVRVCVCVCKFGAYFKGLRLIAITWTNCLLGLANTFTTLLTSNLVYACTLGVVDGLDFEPRTA